ncbi:6610_t:CDS:2 [Funneliformis geosporum]|uniref:6610_t:CDS:1 n=1 Tax=Funneliformis geosporum TaxID=1117311 RepID=A0A9W4X3W4_9GLOM|nr:6610_t:CDS:2 [Funneliformis geosporum]
MPKVERKYVGKDLQIDNTAFVRQDFSIDHEFSENQYNQGFSIPNLFYNQEKKECYFTDPIKGRKEYVKNIKLKCLENASEEEIAELRSEISSIKNQLYQAKKDV